MLTLADRISAWGAKHKQNTKARAEAVHIAVCNTQRAKPAALARAEASALLLEQTFNNRQSFALLHQISLDTDL